MRKYVGGDAPTGDGVMTKLTKQSVWVVLALIAMLVIVLVVLYIVSAIKKNKLSNVGLHDKIIALDNRDVVPFKIESSAISLPSVGQEYSYTFWLYLSDQYDSTSTYKLLFSRGNASALPNKFSYQTNPIVFFDKNANKLYIAISTSAVKGEDKTYDDILQQSTDGRYISGYMISYIDYVPMQRWVNVTFFIKDDKMLVFLDGDMYTAVTVSDVYNPSAVTSGSAARPIIRDSTGEGIIGDKKSTIKGFLSYSRFFNYALTQNEIKAIYANGPTRRSMLALFGLNQYGVRSPIYNLEDDAKKA